MVGSIQNYAYSQSVIEFVTVAAQTCLTIEHIEEQEKQDFLERILQMLPLLYIKTRALQTPEHEMEGYMQHFVTEEYYNTVSDNIKQLLGQDDVYLEVFQKDMRYSEEPISAFISENIADIYQELKDMAANYRTEDEDVMIDAIVACIEAFHEHWGQKLLNVLRALHCLSENKEE